MGLSAGRVISKRKKKEHINHLEKLFPSIILADNGDNLIEIGKCAQGRGSAVTKWVSYADE
jgi:hypothetical protein